MRIVFVGASTVAYMTARILIERKHEVVIIESNKDRIDELSSELDCGFLHGDGSRPSILREAGPADSDFLLCLADSDQTNIIASLVGKSLGFRRIVTKIDNEDLEHICTELGLSDTIIPKRTISRFLTDMIQGRDILELSSMIKGNARFFSFIAREEDEGEMAEVKLPKNSGIICLYREGQFMIAGEGGRIKKGDEVIVLTDIEHLPTLREMWTPKGRKGEDAEKDEDARTDILK